MNKDVAIIGGSAAGLFTAYLLGRKGCNVRVYEAEEEIQSSPRTLIVTSYMQNLMGSLCQGAVVNRVRCYELFADGRVATISLRRPDMVIERSKLIQSLTVRAEANGVQILKGQRFLNLSPNRKRLTFTISNNGSKETLEESVNILVGADGAFSEVARSSGWPKQTTISILQAIVELPKDMPSDITRIWFSPEDTPYFYWLIPHSQTEGVLGLISEEKRKSWKSLELFLERKGLVPIEFQSAQIPLYTRWVPIHRKIGEGHVYLVGDAAGHVKDSTVGGIITGFRGASYVAEAIINSRYSRKSLDLRMELSLHLLIRRVLNHFTQADYAKLLNMLEPSTKRSLAAFTRDQACRLLLHVFLRQPRVILLGFQSLVREY